MSNVAKAKLHFSCSRGGFDPRRFGARLPKPHAKRLGFKRPTLLTPYKNAQNKLRVFGKF